MNARKLTAPLYFFNRTHLA